ncbi:MAG: hypothetical protein NVS1B11_37830 [Terriglobales bacterium]
MTVTAGSIDVLTNSFFGSICTQAGGGPICIDTVGAGNGRLETTTSFGPGTYTVSFDLAGNQYYNQSNSLRVSLGSFFQDYTLNSSDQFRTITFTTTLASSGVLAFDSTPFADNSIIGLLIDNVKVTQIKGQGDATPTPEPATMVLLGTGLAGIGARIKRKRQTKEQ